MRRVFSTPGQLTMPIASLALLSIFRSAQHELYDSLLHLFQLCVSKQQSFCADLREGYLQSGILAFAGDAQ